VEDDPNVPQHKIVTAREFPILPGEKIGCHSEATSAESAGSLNASRSRVAAAPAPAGSGLALHKLVSTHRHRSHRGRRHRRENRIGTPTASLTAEAGKPAEEMDVTARTMNLNAERASTPFLSILMALTECKDLGLLEEEEVSSLSRIIAAVVNKKIGRAWLCSKQCF